ncbi:SSS family solute:Na+ symporter [Catalinimonas alkaloidigena]|uniref:sodium:solute symporter n=1 Tax=Catalinimonas alkaloidigena TaxID=1075417 RepID=UPI002404A1DF|nr:sodium:solute symporter [Catalinimonas alkaloidigena]MDF9796635.1 SSS family solute:Na+ symporter [Catalinimonas alkaloidigena]
MGVEFRALDIVTLLIYLAAMAGLGYYFSKKNNSTEEYFVGNRSFKGWVIGLSMLSTSISSITFLAFPAAAYTLDWRQLISNLMLPLAAVLAIVVFIPFFRRGKLTSAFEYLGDRFGPVTRLYGTVSFLILQIIRIGQILFLVAIPVNLFTGIPIVTTIMLVGVFIAFYTVIGGIDAVIWTDVIQAIVLWIGGVICLVLMIDKLPEGFTQVFEIADANQKFGTGSMEWNLNERTFWTVALLGIFHFLAMYSSDQNVIQRYVASQSTREARKATLIYSVVALPTWSLFFFIGTTLFAFYTVFPETVISTMEADQVFPYFILSQLPAGVAGLIIAAVLAAGMSTLDSSINAIATVTVVDILKPYWLKGQADAIYLRMARYIAIGVSLLMMGGAFFFSVIEKESINDISWIVSSVFGGCLVGLFMIGFFTTRVGYRAVLWALLISVSINLYLGISLTGILPEAISIDIQAYWVGVIVNLLFIALAYIFSFFIKNKKELDGLTVWTTLKAKDIKVS